MAELDLSEFGSDPNSGDLDLSEFGNKNSSNVIEAEKEIAKDPTIPPVKKAVMMASKFALTPGRGTRAIGVGLENLATHPTQPGNAVLRANEALKPSYEAPPGEKLGSFVGSMADPINIAASAVPGGGVLSTMAGAGSASGVQSALLQGEKTGTVAPGQTALDTAMGAGVGAVVHGATHAAGSYIKRFPEVAEFLANAPKRASLILKNHPEIFEKFKGSQPEIVKYVQNVIDTTKDISKAADEYFGQALETLGIKSSREEKLNFKPLSYKAGKEKGFSMPSMGGDVTTAEAENYQNLVRQAAGRELAPNDINGQFSMIKQYGDTMKPAEKLKSLLHIRNSIDHWVDFMPGDVKETVSNPQVQNALKGIRVEVNDAISKSVGGEVLRDADAVVSEAKRAYNGLQKAIQGGRGQAEDYLRGVFSGEGGENVAKTRGLFAIERISGKPVISKLFKSLTSEEFQKAIGQKRLSGHVGGLSMWIVAHALSIPYALGVALGSFAQSPNILAKSLKIAGIADPYLSKLAVPGVAGALTKMKNRKINEIYGNVMDSDSSLAGSQ